MNAAEIHALLEEHGAIQQGHFKLSSGRHSDVFVQTALVLNRPGIAERLGLELAKRFESDDVSVVLAPAVAGLIVGHEVARHLNVPMLFCERVDGAFTLRRGFELAPHDRVLVVDNAMTDGGSKLEVIDLARSHGAEVVGIAMIVDRSQGVSLGVRTEALLDVAASAWDAEACPLCARGEELIAPGSRHLTR